MPATRLEDNPPQLFGGEEIVDLATGAAAWFLIRTQHNHEKAFAWQLLEWGVPFYLPMTVQRDKSRHRRLLPLLPRYLFAAPMQGQEIKRSKHLCGAAMVSEDWMLVRDLAEIKSGIESGTIKTMYDLKPGQLARITDGALRGIEGRIERIDERHEIAFLVINNKEIKIPLSRLEPAA